MAAGRIGEDTLLIIDLSDLSKKYAKKMEYLATVRDGIRLRLRTAGGGVDAQAAEQP